MPKPKFNYVVEVQRPFDLGDDIIATSHDYYKVKEWARAKAVLTHQQDPTWDDVNSAWVIKKEGDECRYVIHTVLVI